MTGMRVPSQRLHAAAVLLLPTAALPFAAYDVVQGRLQTWHWALALVLYLLTMQGATLGFHRLLSHKSFRPHPLVKGWLLVFGSMAAQGPPIYWAGNHRCHHRHADQPGDPHSPYWAGDEPVRGALAAFWHGHIGWIFEQRAPDTLAYCKDLFKDPAVVWVNQRYHLWVMLGLALPAAIGAAIEGSLIGAWQGLVWGGGVRAFFTYHFSSAVNSLGHMVGQRPFATRERSTNSLWLAIPTLGDAWHNNHHACPSAAFHGFRWWQIDFNGYVVRTLERVGLVSDVVRPDANVLDKLRTDKPTPQELTS